VTHPRPSRAHAVRGSALARGALLAGFLGLWAVVFLATRGSGDC
jgi:hypothetical protein